VKEGSILSISIEIKNERKPLSNVIIKDFVPSMFSIVKDFETIKPAKREREDGTELTWRIGRLKPFEERVLHYKVKTQVGIIGDIKLPKAEIRGKIERKVFSRKSNQVILKGVKEKK
jgi:hypothetical protein